LVKKSILSSNQIKEIEKANINRFIKKYGAFILKCQQYGLILDIIPCYYYNGKYHTQPRITKCYLSFRIRCYPSSLTFNQSIRNHLYKEFFSHKILDVQKKKDFYEVKEFSTRDISLEKWLQNLLKRAENLQKANKDAKLCAKERLLDVLVSCIYIYRFRNEVKKTYRGFYLGWILLIVTIALIALSEYMHLKYLFWDW